MNQKIDVHHPVRLNSRCRAGDGELVTIVRRGEGDRWIASNGWRYSSNGRLDPDQPDSKFNLKEHVYERIDYSRR